MSHLYRVFLYSFLSVLILLPAVEQSSLAQPPEPSNGILKNVSTGFNSRLRYEYWNTFNRAGSDADSSYDFVLSRTRVNLDLDMEKISFHIMGQGVFAGGLPDDGIFGPGPAYFNVNDMDTTPAKLHLAQLYLDFRDIPLEGFYLRAGRIGITEGTEVLYGEAKFDWVKRARLSERLVGNWDWTNSGRRFDGGAAGYTNDILNVNIFAANVLKGGFNIDDGFKRLDDVVIAGGALTIKKDVLIPDTEFRVFNIFYFDNREPARNLADGNLKINTTGMSMVGVYDTGPGKIDSLLWFSYQTGSFGALDQRAFGFIGELGYQFTEVLWKPWIRAGFGYASGDSDPDDSKNRNFFNLVPTNHKWYGYMDTIAFSNLENYYFQFFLFPHEKLTVAVDGNYFRLASAGTPWTGGSGAFSNNALGYVFFTPADGEEIRKNLGFELDLTFTYRPLHFITIEAGYSRYFGGSGVQAVFDERNNMDWLYAQATVHFHTGR